MKNVFLSLAVICLVSFAASAQNKKGEANKKKSTTKEVKHKSNDLKMENKGETKPTQPNTNSTSEESFYYPPKQDPAKTEVKSETPGKTELKPKAVKKKGKSKEVSKGKK